MSVVVKRQTSETRPRGQGIVPNVISGLATGLFSIPEGMAYAQLAGVNPVYGLYSGVVATSVSSLSMGMVLMMGMLTSAIALAAIGTGDFVLTTRFGWALAIVYFINGIVTLLALFGRTRAARGRRLAVSAEAPLEAQVNRKVI